MVEEKKEASMKRIIEKITKRLLFLSAMLLLAVNAEAMIDGVAGPNFTLTTKADHISTADGNSVMIWGFDHGIGRAQYPGGTLIVNQGDIVTVTLYNTLPVPVSIVFPGQEGVTAAGSQTTGPLAMEVAPGTEAAPSGPVTYSFTATRPGTFLYHSGTMPEIQMEMGLLGALIVRPTGYNPSAPQAYGHTDTAYASETLFLLTEMDSHIHDIIELQGVAAGMTTLAGTDYLSNYFPNYWFMNGRTAPDTMSAAGDPMLPTQPYDCMPMIHPGEKLLLRVISAGRDLHPLHTHGNHVRIIAQDGRLLESIPGVSGPDLATTEFTFQATPGETYDAIFQWTGKGLGWDVYGHASGDSLAPFEDPADHGKPFPVALPAINEITAGDFYSGSPFLGAHGSLPPGQGKLGAAGGYTYMWHSHSEKELTNYDIFPGGMMTMLVILPHQMP